MAKTRERLAAIELHRNTIADYQVASTAGTDPIFTAIDAHCRACAAYHAASDDDDSGAAMGHEGDVLCELMRCRPTTLAGVLALLHHLGQPKFLIYDRKEDTDMIILEQVVEICPDDELRAFPFMLADTLRSLMDAPPDGAA